MKSGHRGSLFDDVLDDVGVLAIAYYARVVQKLSHLATDINLEALVLGHLARVTPCNRYNQSALTRKANIASMSCVRQTSQASMFFLSH